MSASTPPGEPGPADDVVPATAKVPDERQRPAAETVPDVPKTIGAPAAAPAPKRPAPSADDVILSVRDLRKTFGSGPGFFGGGRDQVHAVDGIDLDVRRGETFGLVGESGCGKSTTARMICRLEEPTSGRILFEGTDVATFGRKALLPFRRDVQMVFQDPYSSLNPRHTVGGVIGEPLIIHGVVKDAKARQRRVQELMDLVGLNPEHYNRLPHEFSGGQRQRIGIARALALDPKLLIADEPVSALDVSIQAQVLNLLRRLQRDLGLTLLFIAHDLSVVRYMCDRVAVMYAGKILELADSDDLYHRPQHEYTKALLRAVPVPEPGARKRSQAEERPVEEQVEGIGADAPAA